MADVRGRKGERSKEREGVMERDGGKAPEEAEEDRRKRLRGGNGKKED